MPLTENRRRKKDVIMQLLNDVMYFNTLISNHFHSLESFLFSSAKPREFDGMLGSGLPVSMYYEDAKKTAE
jgi:hypothetical protein